MKGADKGVWCWACKLLSKQRRVVVRYGIKWGEVVRPMAIASANCGQDPQWHYTQCSLQYWWCSHHEWLVAITRVALSRYPNPCWNTVDATYVKYQPFYSSLDMTTDCPEVTQWQDTNRHKSAFRKSSSYIRPHKSHVAFYNLMQTVFSTLTITIDVM